jgi:diguanylate cyclase (GGDEF)-like protein
VYPEWLTISAVTNAAGTVTHYVGTLTDITLRKAAEEEIRSLAFYDPLTRLPNRRLLLDRLQQALAASARSGRQGALLFLDLDHFKALNDSAGHDQGDLLLQLVAQRLTTCIREGDTVSRFGGDEFVIMLVDLSALPEESLPQAETVAQKILATLGLAYDLAGRPYWTSASIGITLFSDHQAPPRDLLKQADLAMYEAKATGRNKICFFSPELKLPPAARDAIPP